MEIQLGNRILKSPGAEDLRIAQLIWGDAGCGKTTLAATAPGHKLWLLFDPDGDQSIVGRPDVLVLDLSAEKHYIVEKFKDDNPFGMEKMLNEHPEIETVVFDSATSYAYLGLQNAVANTPNAKLERPGIPGYSYRNAVALRCATSLMSLTKRLNRHIIFITHEGTPNTDDDGKVLSIGMALSEGVGAQLGLRLNEVWHMRDDGKPNQRTISVRPCRLRKPMKTRMWKADTTPEFVWKFDPNEWKGDGIATWFEAWKAGGGRKLALPK